MDKKQNNNKTINQPQNTQRSTQYIMAKIQQMIPQLKSQVAHHLRNTYRTKNKQILKQKRQSIKQQYTQKIQQQMKNINQTIKQKIIKIQSEYQQKKIDILTKNKKKKTLTKKQEQQIIEQTVQNILNDADMLNQVKRKIQPKVRQKIHMMLDYQMNELCQQARYKMQQESTKNKEQWSHQREQFWKKQSKNELQVLAQQYKQLQSKKNIIEQALQSKKQERQNVRRKLRQTIDKNQQIFRLKKDIQKLQSELF